MESHKHEEMLKALKKNKLIHYKFMLMRKPDSPLIIRAIEKLKEKLED